MTVILTDAMGSHHTSGVTTFIHESHGLVPHQWTVVVSSEEATASKASAASTATQSTSRLLKGSR